MRALDSQLLDQDVPRSRNPGSRSPNFAAARGVPPLALAAALALLPAPGAHAQEEADGLTFDEDLVSALEFRFIGPSNMSGRITAFAVEPGSRGKTTYVGMASGGVWKTTNMGVTWQPIFNDQGVSSIGDVVLAPSDPDQVWVGTGERNSLRSNSWGDGIYKSLDGGRSWKHMGLRETQMIGRMVIHPEDPNTVYVGALGRLWGAGPERGVYKSTDGGETWDQLLFVNDTTGVIDLKMDPRNPDVLWAATWHRIRWGGGRMEGAGEGSGIWKSVDGGATWTELTDPALDNGLPTKDLGRIGLGIAPSDPNIMYAVMQVAHSARSTSISPFGGVFRSADSGDTWTRVHDISAVPDYFYNEVWIDPDDPDHVILGATVNAHSEDGGITFENKRYSRVHVDNHALWWDPEDSDHMVLGNDGGVYVTWDGTNSWAHQIIPAAQFYEVDVDTTKIPYHVCGGMQDNGTWCGPNRTRESVGITEADWYNVSGGDGFVSAVSPDEPHIRYAESQYGNIRRINTVTMETTSLTPISEDAGAQSGYAFRWDWNTPFMISHHDPTTLYVGANHLFRMTDRGERWRILGPDMTRGNRFDPWPDSAHTSYRSLHSVAESTLTADIVWTGSNDGLVWVSTDRGETWTNVTPNLPQEVQHCWVGEIHPSVHDESTAYVAHDCHRRDDYDPHVYRTTDNGQTWTDITGDLPEGYGSYVVREDLVNPDLLFVGTEQGAFASMDGGGEWVRLSEGLPTAPVRDMELVGRTRELVVATFGRGIYIVDIGPLQELTAEVLAADAHLFEVLPARQYNQKSTYGSFGDQFFRTPNPAYGATITYILGSELDDPVSLTIRKKPAEGEEGDGERIRTLSGSRKAGLHQVQWDLTRQSARPRQLGDPAGGGFFGGGGALRRVEAGEYEVSMTVGEESYTRTIVVEEGWVEENPGGMR